MEINKGVFREAAGYIKEARQFIYLAVGIYVAGLVVGFTFPERFRDYLLSFQDLADQLRAQDTLSLIFLIFLKNTVVAFISVLAGALFGIVPLASAFINGILFGEILSLRVLSLWEVFIRVLPHGAFELPAIFIAWGVGIWRGMWLFSSQGKGQIYRERAKKSYRIFIFIIVPLLLIAAVIEGLYIKALQ